MDRELIERLAREADLIHSVTTFRFVNPPNLTPHGELLCRFAALIAEECAIRCDEIAAHEIMMSPKDVAGHCARAIRERFKP